MIWQRLVDYSMKVLIVPPNDLLRHPIPNRLYHIAKRLAERYDIFLLSYTNHPLAGSVKRSLKAIEVPIPKAVPVKDLSMYYTVNSVQIYNAINCVIKEEGIDIIIHANILPSLIASKLAKKYSIPNIYDFLDYFPQSAAAYYRHGGLVESVVKAIVKQALLNSDAIVTPSHALKLLIKQIIEPKYIPIYVIPNGVDADIFKPMDQKLARKAIGLDGEYYLMLLYGSLDVWLDIVTILRIISKMRARFDIRLLIVGFSHAGHYYKALLNLIKKFDLDKYTYFYPPQPYEKIPIFINASDVVVAPYAKILKNYTTPLKIAEALACGVPVITTAIAEFKIWYKQGVYLYNNFEELEKLLSLIIKSKEEVRRALIEYSHQFRQLFSWDNLANKYISIIDTLMN
jgi:glycosyltransferase involved in cell wall biosynthesis